MQEDSRQHLLQVQKITVWIAEKVRTWIMLALTKRPTAKIVQLDLHKNRLEQPTVCRARQENTNISKEQNHVWTVEWDVRPTLLATIKMNVCSVLLAKRRHEKVAQSVKIVALARSILNLANLPVKSAR
jgi:hypothetical protein